MFVDLGLLVLRLVTGSLLVGHGSQKLFGWFGGYGPAGTAGWLESLGLRPGSVWAYAAGLSEFVGGLLTALGLFRPLGSIVIFGPMGLATARVHWGKPIWVSEGGAELPVTNMAIATAVALTGPGRFSVDRALGIRAPWQISALLAVATTAGIALGAASRPAPSPQAEESASGELQGRQEAPAPARP